MSQFLLRSSLHSILCLSISSPPLNLSTSPSAVIPRTDPKTTPRLPFPSPFYNPKLQGDLTTGTRLRILSWNQTSDLRIKLLLLLLLLHQKLPLSYTTAKEKEKSTKSLPIWGNICEDCSELPIYVRNFLRQKHTISSTIDQPVWLNFLEEEKKLLRSRMFDCLTE